MNDYPTDSAWEIIVRLIEACDHLTAEPTLQPQLAEYGLTRDDVHRAHLAYSTIVGQLVSLRAPALQVQQGVDALIEASIPQPKPPLTPLTPND